MISSSGERLVSHQDTNAAAWFPRIARHSLAVASATLDDGTRIPFSLRDAGLGERGRAREVEHRVGEDRGAGIVHAMQVEEIEARVRQQVEVRAPERLVEKPPGGFRGILDGPEQVRAANGDRRRPTDSGWRGKRRGAVQAQALGHLESAVHGARIIAAHDPGRAVERDDDIRLGARIQQ